MHFMLWCSCLSLILRYRNICKMCYRSADHLSVVIMCLLYILIFNSFPTSGDFCRLLITFADSLDPDQAWQNIHKMWYRSSDYLTEVIMCLFIYLVSYLFPRLWRLLSSTDNLCKQFGCRSGPTKRWAWSGSKLCDTLMVLLKDFLKKLVYKKKKSIDDKKACKITQHAKS